MKLAVVGDDVRLDDEQSGQRSGADHGEIGDEAVPHRGGGLDVQPLYGGYSHG